MYVRQTKSCLCSPENRTVHLMISEYTVPMGACNAGSNNNGSISIVLPILPSTLPGRLSHLAHHRKRTLLESSTIKLWYYIRLRYYWLNWRNKGQKVMYGLKSSFRLSHSPYNAQILLIYCDFLRKNYFPTLVPKLE